MPKLDDVLARLRGVKKHGDYWAAFCPAHDDRKKKSLSVRYGRHGEARVKCFVGCEGQAIFEVIGLGETNGAGYSAQYRHNSTTPLPGLTLGALAHAKHLPVDFLKKLGLCDDTFAGVPAVQIQYRDHRGTPVATRYRCALEGEGRFKWKKGTSVMPYGLESLAEIRRLGWVLFVEGESDRWTACYHGHANVIGIPGKSTWRQRWAAEFVGLTVYCWQEPEAESLTAKLAASFPELRVFFAPSGVKDLSAAHLAGLDVPTLLAEVKACAIPYPKIRQQQAQTKLRALETAAAPVLASDNPLGLVVEAAKAQGYGGDTTALQLAYLSATSRLLRIRKGSMPLHLMLVGPPSSGKSYAATLALDLLPPEAVYRCDASSPRAMLYTEESFKHRVLFFAEKDSLPDDRKESYEDNAPASAIRHLLQEGCLRYQTVERGFDNKFVTVTRVKEGPTALLTTGIRRAAAQLDSRLFVFDVPDDPGQISRAIEAQAAMEARGGDPAPASMALFEPLLAFQSLLQKMAPFDVQVPFALALGRAMTRPGRDLSPRANRDFARIVAMIKASAILHQARRRRDDQGRILATLADYSVVHKLIRPLYDGAVTGATDRVRQVVAAVRTLTEENHGKGVSQASVREALLRRSAQPFTGLDKGAISRVVTMALKNEWLRNTESRKGFPHELVCGDALPTTGGLPNPEELEAHMEGRCGVVDVPPPTPSVATDTALAEVSVTDFESEQQEVDPWPES